MFQFKPEIIKIIIVISMAFVVLFGIVFLLKRIRLKNNISTNKNEKVFNNTEESEIIVVFPNDNQR
ncbi:MAG: hypothetical protein IJR70_02725 [Eubacterium sp.]|nr:hypothetical protein [Eubacterium sp.]